VVDGAGIHKKGTFPLHNLLRSVRKKPNFHKAGALAVWKREGVIDVQIHHFVGEFDVGEDLVYVVVAGAHRQNVFPVLEEAVERYKGEAPIFKKEYVIDKEGVTKSR